MAPGITEEMTRALAQDRSGLVSASTADRVTELLRTHIMEGLFPPGTRLSEEVIGQALGVSRNTLREAFRLLCHERLAVHQMNRGIFVPVLTRADVTDLYVLRRLVEGGAARLAGAASMTGRLAVRAAVDAAEGAASAGRWFEVRTADLRFHQAVAALANSPRVDELMRRALAELRLIFHAMADPEQFHAPYLQRNRIIAEAIMLGRGEAAEKELMTYLADAERQILDVYRVPA
ncbi:MAG TPA: GntR family transcriptional regulator [Streptosporangiaceae bacterium]|nr:GntR family transcriptional regulator [Streptosporangiaceae bacterium]